MNRRHRLLALPLAAMLLLGLAGQALAAPPPYGPSYSASVKVSRDCVFTITVAWKNANVAHLYVAWFESGFVNVPPDHVATQEWPSTIPGNGVAKGKTIVFDFGPFVNDTASHDWWAVVSYYSPEGVLLAQRQPTWTTNCYLANS